jgi:hypothetical protein
MTGAKATRGAPGIRPRIPGRDPSQAMGYPNNPRYESKPDRFDVRTPEGLAQFQARVIQQARDVVENLKKLNAQGAITWNIEGEQYPQTTRYACAPDEIAHLAPEMGGIMPMAPFPYTTRIQRPSRMFWFICKPELRKTSITIFRMRLVSIWSTT